MNDRSAQRKFNVGKVKATVINTPGLDSPDLGIARAHDRAFKLTHWSFSQLCTYADAPASYMRTLPAELAAKCLNTGLEKYSDANVQLLFHKNDDSGNDATMRAITSDQYSRLWDLDVVRALRPAIENGWVTPPARPVRDDPRCRIATLADIIPGQENFGLSVKVGDKIGPAGVYRSDRDFFAFQVNPNRVIDIDGDSLMRGFFVENSEVGYKAFKVTLFYLESVCGNHIIHNFKGFKSLRIVHKGNNFSDIGYKLERNLRSIANADTTMERGMVHAARNHVLGKDKEQVVEILYNNKVIGLTKATVETAYDLAEKWEHTAHSAPNTAWGLVHATTRLSQTLPYADERAKMDAAAGRLLQLAYTARKELVPVRG
jgi:hypothetical protein